MQFVTIPFLLQLAFAEAAAPAAPRVYALDGIAIGSNAEDVLKRLHRPYRHVSGEYYWTDDAGGTTRITADGKGRIIIVAIHAAPNERRSIDVPGDTEDLSLTFYDSSHMSYYAANATYVDVCNVRFEGRPCWVYTFANDVDLLLNFGADNGTADWDLTDAVLGRRNAMRDAHFLKPPSDS
jgi:hypothetical protein